MVSPEDKALAAALHRWLPDAEAHEIETVRDRLRAQGLDIAPLNPTHATPAAIKEATPE